VSLLSPAARQSTPLVKQLAEFLVFLTSGSRGWAKYYSSTGDLFIRIQNVDKGQLSLKDVTFVDPPDDAEARRTAVQAGDVLLSITADLGRSCVIPEGLGRAYVNQHLAILRTEGLNPRFLSHYLVSPGGLAQIQSLNKHVVKAGLNFNDIRSLEIPVLPLPEQRRIADILDRAETLRAKRRSALAQLDELTRAIFVDMFGDPVTNPNEWPVVSLSSLGKLDRGVSKHRPRNAPELLGGPYPLIQTGDIANSDGYIRSFRTTYSELGLRQSRLWPAGTLCITIAANIAETAILKMPACFPDSVVGFLAEEAHSTEYIRFWFGFIRQSLEEQAPEVAQKNINLAILRELKLPLPPLPLQQEFARRIQAIDRLKSLHRQSLAELDALFQCLQHRAFRGEF